MSQEMKKQILFEPGFDRRDKTQGVHGMQIRFVLSGPKGATQFVLFTDWLPPEWQREQMAQSKSGVHQEVIGVQPMGADVGYHALVPQYEGQSNVSKSCEFLGGKGCYYDGSGMEADALRDKFLKDGVSVVWETLQEWYDDLTI